MGQDQSVTKIDADFDGSEVCAKLKLPPEPSFSNMKCLTTMSAALNESRVGDYI